MRTQSAIVNTGPVLAIVGTDMGSFLDLDLDPIKMKLTLPAPEGKGWSEGQADVAITWYRRFLFLCATYPAEPLVPNGPIDEVWHTHILDTAKYAVDCQELFGKFLHHYPYYGLNGDAAERDDSFDKTNALYREHFGEDCRVLGEHFGVECKGESCDPQGCKDVSCNNTVKAGAGCNDSGGGTGCGQRCKSIQSASEGAGCNDSGGGTGCGQRCSKKFES